MMIHMLQLGRGISQATRCLKDVTPAMHVTDSIREFVREPKRCKTCERELLSADERKLVEWAASAVWQELGYDALRALADERGKQIERVTYSQREVIEMVMDANRIEDNLNRHGYKYLAEKLEWFTSDQFTPILRNVFPHGRYGV